MSERRPPRAFRAEKVPAPRAPEFSLPPPGTPLDLEIGCGVGLHPIRYAQAHPDRFLVAIEHTAAKFASFARRVAHHPPLPNLLPVHANAISWVTHRLGEACVDRVFLLYPNPRPRWTDHPFLQRLAWVMKPGATLTLATNLTDYAQDARERLPAELPLVLEEERILESSTLAAGYRPRTHFERKYLARGERCHDLVFRRV
jgi:tRNA (guanine-N7-)-methyltransferase